MLGFGGYFDMDLSFLQAFAELCSGNDTIAAYRQELANLDTEAGEVRYAFSSLNNLFHQVLDGLDTLTRIPESSSTCKEQEASEVFSRIEHNMFFAQQYIRRLQADDNLTFSEQELLGQTDQGLIAIWNFLSELIQAHLAQGFKDVTESRELNIIDIENFAMRLDSLGLDCDPELDLDAKRIYHRLRRVANSIHRFWDAVIIEDWTALDIHLRFAHRGLELASRELTKLGSNFAKKDENLDKAFIRLWNDYYQPLSNCLTSSVADFYDKSEQLQTQMMQLDMSSLEKAFSDGIMNRAPLKAVIASDERNVDDLRDLFEQEFGDSPEQLEQGLGAEFLDYMVNELCPSVPFMPSFFDLQFVVQPKNWQQTKTQGLQAHEVKLNSNYEQELQNCFGSSYYSIMDDLIARICLYFNHEVIPRLADHDCVQELEPGFHVNYGFSLRRDEDLFRRLTGNAVYGDENLPSAWRSDGNSSEKYWMNGAAPFGLN